MSTATGWTGTLLFHLNLSYSAIEAHERPEVVRRCYDPLLGLAERNPWLRLAVEASGHTLERIRDLAPAWLERLGALVEEGRVEFVGSGDSQLIGPLVPAAVNRWNQRLGCATYERLLGHRPRVALVNEMAWSQGIVDAYLDAGYEALVMEWNNPRRVHAEWDDAWRLAPAATRSPAGRPVRLLWADAIAFQKLQRAVFDELDAEEYVRWVRAASGEGARNGDAPRHLFLYANDAEIFDFRPGRYRTEAPLAGAAGATSEWARMEQLLARLHAEGLRFLTPGEVLDAQDPATAPEVRLNDAADPIPVKKQPKYNVTRWALTGRDDPGLNARCFSRARELSERGGSAGEWRALCRAWASDLRTHLTDTRWSDVSRNLPAYVAEEREEGPNPAPERPLRVAEVERGPRVLRIATDEVRLELNPARGLAITALTFPEVSPRPLCGTLPHGHFQDISWSADFYTGHLVLDVPVRARVTDLERVEPQVETLEDRVRVRAVLETQLGPLEKRVDVLADRVELHFGLAAFGERPACSLRAGFVTLLPGGLGEDLWVACANGGAPERFPLASDVDHGASVSPLVSAHTSFGATDGSIEIGDDEVELEMRWPNWRSAAVPMLTSKRLGEERFVRLAFSLAEIDETHRPGAPMRDFSLALRARRRAA